MKPHSPISAQQAFEKANMKQVEQQLGYIYEQVAQASEQGELEFFLQDIKLNSRVKQELEAQGYTLESEDEETMVRWDRPTAGKVS